MRLLVITETLYPKPGNNGNLIGKLVPYLRERHQVEILSMAFGQPEPLPDMMFGVPVHWARDDRRGWKRKLLFPAVSKAVDRGGWSDAVSSMILSDEIRRLDADRRYDVLLTTSEPFVSALSALPFQNRKKLLYIMDPPGCVCGGDTTAYRDKMLPELLQKQDLILTTPFIRAALSKHGFSCADGKTVSVGFPMITENTPQRAAPQGETVRLLYCGWLYSDIRSPQYFLDVVSRLDERFEVTFMGRECETLRERFEIRTRASIVTLPQQPYETALQAMADADVLINIGNSVPVHMPSKTLEYINTGKPVVNFHKLQDCPTLYYTKRYPLCLNLFEGEADTDKAAQAFIDFCLTRKGQMVDHAWIEREYADCTPQYIAQQITDFLEK